MDTAYAHVVTGDAEYASRLGLVVRTARYYRDVTREEVGERTNFNAETIARWERGDVAVPGYALRRLAEVLDLPAALLIEPPESRQDVLVAIAVHDGQRRAERELS
jgi:transcriptional regulator with XRE-family HTH domain